MKKKEAQMFRLVIKARREAMTHEKLTGIRCRTASRYVLQLPAAAVPS